MRRRHFLAMVAFQSDVVGQGLETAKAIGVTIPSSLLTQAAEIIQ